MSSADRTFLGPISCELLGHERDGGERRAQFVRGRGRQAVELGEMLLAREHQLGRGERLGELARLLGHPPGIDADEGERRAGSRTRCRLGRSRGAELNPRPGTQGSGSMGEEPGSWPRRSPARPA